MSIRAAIINLIRIGAPAKAVVTQTGDCGAVSPTRLEPRHRVERRNIHARTRQMREELGMAPSKALQG